MKRPTGIDGVDETHITLPFVEQTFYEIFARRLSETDCNRLETPIIVNDERVVPPFSKLVYNEKYKLYLQKIKNWAYMKWSTAMIVDLLCDPYRDKTGWIANGGTTISKSEWLWMQNS